MLDSIIPSWEKELKNEFNKPYIKELFSFLKKEKKEFTIYPKEENIFKSLNDTPLDKLKVVILGQDPYHGENQANGLAFSVDKEIKLPPSLRNIFKELDNDLSQNTLSNGDLSFWAKQGVLLLNSTLTVRENQANSHQGKGWEIFTDKIIEIINKEKENIVFILWGAYAKTKAKHINKNKHYIITSPHPSPLSSYRGFFGSKPFSKTNDFLKLNKIEPIQWTSL